MKINEFDLFESINVFLKDQFIICFYVDVQNNYWIGTANGLFFISKDTLKMQKRIKNREKKFNGRKRRKNI
mgnify:CR=1 FL=1